MQAMFINYERSLILEHIFKNEHYDRNTLGLHMMEVNNVWKQYVKVVKLFAYYNIIHYIC